MTVDAWATTDEIEDLTGAQVSDLELLQAQDIIELFSGTTILASDNISQTNLRRLNRAVIYQATWAQEHPDIYTAVDVDQASDGSTSFTPSHVNAHLLAPMAKRHLDRLTWRQKPLRLRRRYGQYDYQNAGPRDSAVADDNRLWAPM